MIHFNKRYIYRKIAPQTRASTGFGRIIDTQPVKKWDEEMATVYGDDKAKIILEALNLYNDVCNLKKGTTKKEIQNIFQKYKITI